MYISALLTSSLLASLVIFSINRNAWEDTTLKNKHRDNHGDPIVASGLDCPAGGGGGNPTDPCVRKRQLIQRELGLGNEDKYVVTDIALDVAAGSDVFDLTALHQNADSNGGAWSGTIEIYIFKNCPNEQAAAQVAAVPG